MTVITPPTSQSECSPTSPGSEKASRDGRQQDKTFARMFQKSLSHSERDPASSAVPSSASATPDSLPLPAPTEAVVNPEAAEDGQSAPPATTQACRGTRPVRDGRVADRTASLTGSQTAATRAAAGVSEPVLAEPTRPGRTPSASTGPAQEPATAAAGEGRRPAALATEPAAGEPTPNRSSASPGLARRMSAWMVANQTATDHHRPIPASLGSPGSDTKPDTTSAPASPVSHAAVSSTGIPTPPAGRAARVHHSDESASAPGAGSEAGSQGRVSTSPATRMANPSRGAPARPGSVSGDARPSAADAVAIEETPGPNREGERVAHIATNPALVIAPAGDDTRVPLATDEKGVKPTNENPRMARVATTVTTTTSDDAPSPSATRQRMPKVTTDGSSLACDASIPAAATATPIQDAPASPPPTGEEARAQAGDRPPPAHGTEGSLPVTTASPQDTPRIHGPNQTSLYGKTPVQRGPVSEDSDTGVPTSTQTPTPRVGDTGKAESSPASGATPTRETQTRKPAASGEAQPVAAAPEASPDVPRTPGSDSGAGTGDLPATGAAGEGTPAPQGRLRGADADERKRARDGVAGASPEPSPSLTASAADPGLLLPSRHAQSAEQAPVVQSARRGHDVAADDSASRAPALPQISHEASREGLQTEVPGTPMPSQASLPITPPAHLPSPGSHPAPVDLRPALHLPAHAAPLAEQAVRDSGLSMTVLPHSAHMAIESADGDLALHMRVRHGSAEITVGGSMAPLFEARAPEARVALAGEGLALGRFDLGQQGHGQQGQPAPEAPEHSPEPPAPYRHQSAPSDPAPTDGRIHVTA
jgi:hypothetical protein